MHILNRTSLDGWRGLVTTNYDTEALIDRMTPRESHDSMTARATIDRLMEMCRGITLTGQSWRSR